MAEGAPVEGSIRWHSGTGKWQQNWFCLKTAPESGTGAPSLVYSKARSTPTLGSISLAVLHKVTPADGADVSGWKQGTLYIIYYLCLFYLFIYQLINYQERSGRALPHPRVERPRQLEAHRLRLPRQRPHQAPVRWTCACAVVRVRSCCVRALIRVV